MIKTINHLGLVLLLSILPISLVFASGASLRFEHLSLEQGLPQISATSVIQDQQGFLWIGTRDGLARYDGYRFKVFKHNADDPYSLSSNEIWAIFEDNQGMLWVGTWGGGLNRFNPNTEQFTHYRSDDSNPHSLNNDTVFAITQDRLGMIWLGTRGGGLNRFDPKTEQFSHYRSDDSNPHSLSEDTVTAITQDQQGMLWVGTYGGLNRFNPKTERFTRYRSDANNPNSLSNDKIRIITQDRQGTLWVGTNGGLNRFNPKTEQFTHYRFDADNSHSLSNDTVLAITQDRQGELWVGTWSGLNRFNPKTEQFTRYRFDANNPNSLSDDTVGAIIQDRHGTLWLGTHGGGLNRFNPKTEKFGHYRFDASNPNGLNDDNVRAITQGRHGDLWMGTWSGGLNRLNPKTQQFSHYQFDANDPNSLSDGIVLATTEDRQGILWVGTYGGGLNRFDPNTGQFTRYHAAPNSSNSLSHNTVWAITEDSQGTLWLGTWGGLNRFDPKTNQFTHYRANPDNPNSLSDDTIVAITEDSQGMLWVGTYTGLNRFNPKTGQFTHYRYDPNNPNSLSNNDTWAITEDSQGTLWVGTTNGLNRMDPQTGQFKRFTEKQGLPNNIIHRIEEDNDGFLWLSTGKGLSRFNPVTERFKNFDASDGLQSNEFNSGASFKGNSGELFFGGVKGFNRFFPDEITEDDQMPVVVFTDMLLLNKPVPIGQQALKNEHDDQLPNQGFSLDQAIHLTQELTLTHHENLVSFEFSALHFTNPKKNQFAYRLEGFDKHWITTDYKKRFATYTNLSGGNYVLRVKSSNPDGLWNEEGASVNITVLPPPWKSWWAYTIYVAILIGSLFGFVRSQRQKVLFERRISAHLECKVKERTFELLEANNQLESANLKLEEVSLTDQLTGLKNRRFLNNNIDNDIALTNRQYQNEITDNKPENSDLICFLIDLDHFKQVNDIHGHSAGDAVIVQVKDILKQVFRETDYLIRWGGEEFLVVARFADRKKAAGLAERLRETVERHDFDIGEGKVLKKTCSIGFACYPFLRQQPTTLEWSRIVDVADHCLYAAKKSDRNAWVGIDSTAACIEDDLFARVTGQTQALIDSKELQVFTSISKHNNVTW